MSLKKRCHEDIKRDIRSIEEEIRVKRTRRDKLLDELAESLPDFDTVDELIDFVIESFDKDATFEHYWSVEVNPKRMKCATISGVRYHKKVCKALESKGCKTTCLWDDGIVWFVLVRVEASEEELRSEAEKYVEHIYDEEYCVLYKVTPTNIEYESSNLNERIKRAIAKKVLDQNPHIIAYTADFRLVLA